MSENELYHYGVKGMKWGVRKSVYKSMSRSQKKEQRKKYYQTPEGRIMKTTRIATILGGPIAGVAAGNAMRKRLAKEGKDLLRTPIKDIDKTLCDKGKRFIENGDWKGVDRKNYEYLAEMFRSQGSNINNYKPSQIDEYGRVTGIKYKI